MRGITALIAVVLLLMISVVLAMSTYSWLMSTENTIFGGVETQQDMQLRMQGSQLTLLSADEASGTIYIQNTGKYDLSGFAVYANGSLLDTAVVPTDLAVGDTGTVTLPTMPPGYYEIKITTPYTASALSMRLS